MPKTESEAKTVVKARSSAAKQARVSQRKRLHNQSAKNRIRSGLRRFHDLFQADPQRARDQARQVISWLDRAAKSRVLHPNAARRHKARVMAYLQKLIKNQTPS